MSSWQVNVEARLGNLHLAVQLSGSVSPVALVGPNGSGKTTLLRLVCGAFAPSAGEIQLGERTLFNSQQNICLPPEERRVAYLPQGYALFPHLSVLDNVAFGLTMRSDRTQRRARARQALRDVEAADLESKIPQQLSGGQQQRVALARALVTEPSLLLLDEPLSAMDAGARRRVRATLASKLKQLALPAIVVTHDARDVAALDAHVYVLEAGRVVQQGSLEQLTQAPISDFVAEFVEPGKLLKRGG